ncbi:MAG TPA: RDD family protein [Candidatus Dormibacteraeota bacterium]|nr:RDD family protein [Candidatus Dormibacteraeota bacterium]
MGVPPSAPSYPPSYAPGPVTAMHLAGFWRRLLAYVIDAVVIGVVSGAIVSVITTIIRASTTDYAGVGTRSGLISLIVGLLYFGYLWSRNGQSIGYMALGMRLIRTTGAPVSFGLAAGRYLLIYLSFALCLIPAIISAFMIGLGSQKQAIHDAMVGTLVIRTT